MYTEYDSNEKEEYQTEEGVEEDFPYKRVDIQEPVYCKFPTGEQLETPLGESQLSSSTSMGMLSKFIIMDTNMTNFNIRILTISSLLC